MSIEIEHVSKTFRSARGAVTALKNVSLSIESGEFFVLLGPSGCGKSTLLNIVAGIEKPTEGKVTIDGGTAVSTEEGIFRSPQERNTAMVFQSYALYPHMTVYDNIAFPLKLAKEDKKEIEKRVRDIAGQLGIGRLLDAKPAELSGGQRQRAATGRALVRRPVVLLLDEPLSNLDAQLRISMRTVIKELQREIEVTTIYVTHDQTEAMSLGDRIALLKDGRICQTGTPDSIYHDPDSVFVGRFIGSPPMNTVGGEQFAGIRERIGIGESLDPEKIVVGIRPEIIRITGRENGILDGKISFVGPLGAETIVSVRISDSEEVLVRESGDADWKTGDRVGLDFDPDRLLFFDRESERRIRPRQS